MSISILKALPGKLDIKRHSPNILYISASLTMSTSVLKALPGKLDIKKHSPSILYISASLSMSTSALKALPGKLDIKRHSPSILYILASLAMSTSVFKALPAKLDIKRHSTSIWCISDLSLRKVFILANSVATDEKPPFAAQHFIWVLTIDQNNSVRVFTVQSVKTCLWSYIGSVKWTFWT